MNQDPALHLALSLAREVDLHGSGPRLLERLRARDFDGALALCREAMQDDQELISPNSPGASRAPARQNWYDLRLLERHILQARDRFRDQARQPASRPAEPGPRGESPSAAGGRADRRGTHSVQKG